MEGKWGILCHCGKTQISWTPNEHEFYRVLRLFGWQQYQPGEWRCPEHAQYDDGDKSEIRALRRENAALRERIEELERYG
jgi:hypothetical protein